MSILYRGKTKKEVSLTSALYDAIEDADFSSLVKLLTENRSDPNLVIQKHGIAPFHLAIGNDNEDFALKITKLILQHGGDPNIKSDEWITPTHIAAALGRTEILRLLLSCGGDVQAEDLNNFTPIYYAEKEGHDECLELLRTYLDDGSRYFNREREDCKNYQLKLDKILVNNGITAGEYEVVNEYKTDSIPNENMQKLENLPRADSNEYIMNWFNNLPPKAPYPNATALEILEVTTDSCVSDHTMNESDNENNKDLSNMSFRKRYTKKMSKRRSSKSSSGASPIEIAMSSSSSSKKDSVAFSKTSLPKIELNGCSEAHFFCGFDKTKSSAYSDYNSMEEPNSFERNVFEITDEKDRRSLSIHDETKSFRSNITKSEGIGSSDLSFITAISEVYKYADEAEQVVLYEKRLLKTSVRGSVRTAASMSSLPTAGDYEDIDPNTLRNELTQLGYNPGPITVTTKRIYLKKLKELRIHPIVTPSNDEERVYSAQLQKTLKNPQWFRDLDGLKPLEDVLIADFASPNPTKKWREGTAKCSFTYLLLDPRITCNLPSKAEDMRPSDIWEKFLSAIFYVGKGKRSRPYSHLYEAANLWKQQKTSGGNKKVDRILDIWNDKYGVICLHVFQNTIPVEAYTREAAIITALNLKNISNIKSGDFYGTSSTWTQKEKASLGVILLYRAMLIFINEGERQLCPTDID